LKYREIRIEEKILKGFLLDGDWEQQARTIERFD